MPRRLLEIALLSAILTPAAWPQQGVPVDSRLPATAQVPVTEPLTTTFVGALVPGETGRLAVQWAPASPAQLTGWVDFDGDGAFADTERVMAEEAIGQGIEVFEFAVPRSARITPATRARFRIAEPTGSTGPTPREMTRRSCPRRQRGANGPRASPSTTSTNGS